MAESDTPMKTKKAAEIAEAKSRGSFADRDPTNVNVGTVPMYPQIGLASGIGQELGRTKAADIAMKYATEGTGTAAVQDLKPMADAARDSLTPEQRMALTGPVGGIVQAGKAAASALKEPAQQYPSIGAGLTTFKKGTPGFDNEVGEIFNALKPQRQGDVIKVADGRIFAIDRMGPHTGQIYVLEDPNNPDTKGKYIDTDGSLFAALMADAPPKVETGVPRDMTKPERVPGSGAASYEGQ